MSLVKQTDELTVSDFETSPRWMFYGGPNGEFDSFTTVIPDSHPDYSTDYVGLVRACYRLSNGRELAGYVYDDPFNLDQHTLFVENSSFSLWFGGVEPRSDEIAGFYQALSATRDEVFPIQWHAVQGEYAGQIHGFGLLKGREKVFIK